MTSLQMRRYLARPTALVLVGCAALSLAACGGSGDAESTSASVAQATTQATVNTPTVGTSVPTTSAPAPTRKVTLFFADADAQRLIEESRGTAATGSDLRAALVELANGPAPGSAGQRALPEGTTVVGTNVQGGEALVNLSSAFVTGYPSGGAAAEFAVLAPLVYTATAINGIERVRITVDGQTPAPAGSQFDWSGTLSRADFPDVAAAP
jgi:spore germination protein GerM